MLRNFSCHGDQQDRERPTPKAMSLYKLPMGLDAVLYLYQSSLITGKDNGFGDSANF